MSLGAYYHFKDSSTLRET